MAFIEQYIGLLIGFLSLTLGTAFGLAPKLRSITESRCKSMRKEASKEYPPTTQWNVESIFDLIDRKIEIEEVEYTCDEQIGGLMSMCALLVIGALGGLFLAFSGLLPEALPMVDFLVYAFAGLYAIRIVPIAKRLA
ncbi:MAG: hypothetical protein ACXAEN_18350 [Candidatus Thorarchaeota archaeon]